MTSTMASVRKKCFQVLLFFSLAAFFDRAACQSAEPLYCYQCRSDHDPDCQLLPSVTASSFYKPCIANATLPEPFCRKIYQKIHARDGLVVVIRKCGWVRHPSSKDCYRVMNVDHRQYVCQCFTHGCNTSATLRQPTLLLALALVFMIFPASSSTISGTLFC